MSSYTHKKLKAFAEDRGAWIDVQTRGENRGKGTGNTNRKERISRALSWYEKGEAAATPDEQLIYFYIAFNALYVRRKEGKTSSKKDKSEKDKFWENLQNSTEKRFLWLFNKEHEPRIKKILSFPYLSKAYWGEVEGYRKADEQKKVAETAGNRMSPEKIEDLTYLKEAMDNVAELRNQLLHGMAAYKDSYNRTQVKMCAEFLHALTGCCIKIVIADDKTCWGKVPCAPQAKRDAKGHLQYDELKD